MVNDINISKCGVGGLGALFQQQEAGRAVESAVVIRSLEFDDLGDVGPYDAGTVVAVWEDRK